MGVYRYAWKMVKSTFENCISYIISIAFTTVIVFNTMNLSYNDAFYSKENNLIPTIQKVSLFFLMLIAIYFACIYNSYYIKRKSKEIAFTTINGSTYMELSRFLAFQNGCMLVISVIIGLIISLATLPLFNKLWYLILNEEASVYFLNPASIIITILAMCTVTIYLTVFNFHFSFVKEPIDLIKEQRAKSKADKRIFKLPSLIFVIIYLLPFIYVAFNIQNPEGGFEIGILYITLFAIIGTRGIIKYFIPKLVARFKKKKDMFDSMKIIYKSNFVQALNKSMSYIIGLEIGLIYFVNGLCSMDVFTRFATSPEEYSKDGAGVVAAGGGLSAILEEGQRYSDLDRVKETALYGIIIVCCIIAFGLAYKIIVEAYDNIKIYRNLRLVGYSRKEISTIITKEIKHFFCFGLMLPLIHVLLLLIAFGIGGMLELNTILLVMAFIIIPLAISAIFANYMSKKVILNEIFGGK